MEAENRESQSAATQAEQADLQTMYQYAVQAPETEVEFFEQTYEKLRGKKPLSMKEDFSGTCLLSVEWVKSDPQRTAVCVDICPDTLAWGKEHNIEPAGEEVASRMQIFQADVRDITEPKVDITCALNFSFCIFKTRDALRDYFAKARAGLKDDGMLILDMFGGTECLDILEEETEMDEVDATYIWEHKKFNPITNEILCHIHFEFPDGSRMDKAFTYDWRLWSLPEIKELLEEAGYSKVRIYWEEFEEDEDDEDLMEGTGEFFEASEVENQESWQVYIVAEK
jgi:SAM-dependent methyltransferase